MVMWGAHSSVLYVGQVLELVFSETVTVRGCSGHLKLTPADYVALADAPVPGPGTSPAPPTDGSITFSCDVLTAYRNKVFLDPDWTFTAPRTTYFMTLDATVHDLAGKPIRLLHYSEDLAHNFTLMDALTRNVTLDPPVLAPALLYTWPCEMC